MIEYWYCVNIPPRSLVDLKKKADEKKRFWGPIGFFFFYFYFFFYFFFFLFGSVRFSDWFGSVRVGLVRFTDWFGSRTGSARGLVRFADWYGSVRFADRTGAVRCGSKVLWVFVFEREKARRRR